MLIHRTNEKGVALMSSLFFLIIVTLLAAGALMLSTVQIKVSASIARWESAFAAAEGGADYVLPLIQSVMYKNAIPQVYDPVISDAAAVITHLTDATYSIDPSLSPDVLLPASSQYSINGFDGSIRLESGASGLTAGGAIEASWAYHGGAAYSSSLMKSFIVRSEASTPAGNASACMEQTILLRVH